MCDRRQHWVSTRDSSCRERQWGANGWQLTASVGIQKIRVRDSPGSGCLGKGKFRLVECDMTRDDNQIASQIKALVPFVMSGVSKKNT
jgi:hypothetical protein